MHNVNSSAGQLQDTAQFETALSTTIAAFSGLAEIRAEISRAGQMILTTLAKGGKLLICGNGGSAAEAAHFATELTGRFSKNRRSLPAISLAADGSLLTCIVNDYGADEIFGRQISGLANKRDLLVVLSSSGNSPNIVKALQVARASQISSIAFLGRGGGLAKGLADCDLIVPGQSGAAAQESHLFLIHYFCQLIDRDYD